MANSFHRVRQAVVRSLAALALLFLCSGCFETKQEFTLNPDGSGKVVHETIFCAGAKFGDSSRGSLDEEMQDAVKQMLSNSKGVDAWTDVKFDRLPDGRIHFRGIAYFPSLSALSIGQTNPLGYSLDKQPDGSLVLRSPGFRADDDESKPAPAPEADEEDMPTQILRAKIAYQGMRPLFIGYLSTMKDEAIFHLPGAVSESTNLRRAGQRAVSVSLEGSKVLAAAEAMASQEDWWRRQVTAGSAFTKEGPDFADLEFNARVFGEKAPVAATIQPDGMQFDYPKEVAVAKADYAAFAARLHIPPPLKHPAADSSRATATAVDQVPPDGKIPELQQVRAIGLKEIYEEGGLRFGGPKGLTVGLRGALPFAGVEPAGAQLEIASAGDGSNLLSDNRKIKADELSLHDGELTLDAELMLPGPGPASLRELSGFVDCYIEGPTRKTGFGFAKLMEGGKGNEFKAEVSKLEQPAEGQAGTLKLHIAIDKWRIKSLQFLDAKGRKLDVINPSSSSSNESVDYNYSFRKPLPEGAHIEAEIYDPPVKTRASFKLENVPLPARP